MLLVDFFPRYTCRRRRRRRVVVVVVVRLEHCPIIKVADEKRALRRGLRAGGWHLLMSYFTRITKPALRSAVCRSLLSVFQLRR